MFLKFLYELYCRVLGARLFCLVTYRNNFIKLYCNDSVSNEQDVSES